MLTKPLDVLNTQHPEGYAHRTDGQLDVHSVFFTIQGEGPFSGQRAVFVRLAGCNFQCPNCDTDYTSKREMMGHLELANLVSDTAASNTLAGSRWPIVVITGGEPLRQNIGPFIQLLFDRGFIVQLEVNGSMYQETLPWDSVSLVVVCSPKSHRLHPQLEQRITHYKYVGGVGNICEKDGLPLDVLGRGVMPARPPKTHKLGAVYLQPEDTGDEHRNAANARAVAESCMQFGHIAQLQAHKYLGVN